MGTAPRRRVVRMRREMPLIGWRETVALPELGVERIQVKVDTGARSSALHAFRLEEFERDGVPHVRFEVHPFRKSRKKPVKVELPVHDRRTVRSSNGRVQTRYAVRTPVRIAGRQWLIDLTLTNRDEMGFRMLLGREAIRGRFLVHAGRSFLTSESSEAESTARTEP